MEKELALTKYDGGEDSNSAVAARTMGGLESRSGSGLSLLCIDADSKDSSLAMSAPPVEFTSDQCLDDMSAYPTALFSISHCLPNPYFI